MFDVFPFIPNRPEPALPHMPDLDKLLDLAQKTLQSVDIAAAAHAHGVFVGAVCASIVCLFLGLIVLLATRKQ